MLTRNGKIDFSNGCGFENKIRAVIIKVVTAAVTGFLNE
jgi:hypothetical protein